MTFTVIDKKTGKYPDTQKIALKEKWASNLIYCDIDCFAIKEDGSLVLIDDCGNVAYCPPDRFDVSFDNENPWHTGTPTEEGWYVLQHKGNYEPYLEIQELSETQIYILQRRPFFGDIVAWQKIEPYKEEI